MAECGLICRNYKYVMIITPLCLIDIVDNLRTYRVCDYSKLSSETLCCIFLYIHFTRALSNLYESYAEFVLME